MNIDDVQPLGYIDLWYLFKKLYVRYTLLNFPYFASYSFWKIAFVLTEEIFSSLPQHMAIFLEDGSLEREKKDSLIFERG